MAPSCARSRFRQEVQVGKIEASFANGVLTVKLPKSVAAMQAETQIVVKAA